MDSEVTFPENWKPPRELVRALPRETHLTRSGAFLAILAAVILLACVILYFVVRHQEMQTAAQTAALRTEGRETTAEITHLWLAGKSSIPNVMYAFTANGVRLKGESKVPKRIWDRLRKAGFLPVRFLPSNPSINHPAAWEESASPFWLPLLVPAVISPGAIVILTMLWRHGRVAANGLPTAGVVTKCFAVKNGWSARYRFRTKDGAVFGGSSQVGRRLEAGTTLCILYLPEKPRRNAVYPMGLYRVTP